MTHYLRFSSEDEAKSVMSEYYQEGWVTASLVHALDPVGILYNNDAVFDEQGNVITEPTQKQGWHVNFIGELPNLAQSYIINLTSPDRIFAN